MTIEYALLLIKQIKRFHNLSHFEEEACDVACAAIQEKIDLVQESKNSVKEVCENCKWYEKYDECWNGVCELMPGPVFEPDDSCNKFIQKEELSK